MFHTRGQESEFLRPEAYIVKLFIEKKKKSKTDLSIHQTFQKGFPVGSVGKESTCSAGDKGHWGSIPGSGRSPGGGNSKPLQYACLGDPMDRGAWWASGQGVMKELDTTELLSTQTFQKHMVVKVR